MSSILTNTNAMAALQTLRTISTGMEETQARISSGLRVGSASDNAAYWSIATTMRSDNAALSTVQDAMGLGAAKVDVASAGMESAIKLVQDIRTKLASAKESSADKTKIQSEITQLQQQLKGISESASFSGENWLEADLSKTTAENTKNVVGSFVRDASGSVSVKKVEYTLDSSTVLFDTSATGAKSGVLDVVAKSGTNAVNLTEVEIVKDVISTKTADDLIANGATFNDGTDGVAVGGGTAAYMESFSLIVGGSTETYVRKYNASGDIQTDATTGKELWARIKVLDATADAKLIAKSDEAQKTTGGTFTNGTSTYYYAEDQVSEMAKVTGLTKAALESIKDANGSAVAKVSGRVATIGTSDTYIQVDASKDVWVRAVAGSATDDVNGIDIDGKNWDIDAANKQLPAALAGADLGFSVSNFDLKDLDTVGQALGATAGNREGAALDFMIQFVDTALTKMTSSASSLGSISKRIDLQSDFLSKLTDSIDKGVGRLVDADMNEESTRLKALQTQQQLAIQSLSIANSDSQNILSLFR